MPGCRRGAEAQGGGQPLHHGDALRAERGERAGGTGEADQLDARAKLVEPRDMGVQRLHPDRAFQAEGNGQRVLKMRPSRHDGVAVTLGLQGQGRDDGREFRADQRQAGAHLKHRGAVHDVLRRGAPMGPAARLPGGAR
jgi:hypothetical protein